MPRARSILFTLFMMLALPFFFGIVLATPNIGMLRVASFICPREVLPGAAFPASLDLEYAVQGLPNNATIRGAIYSGSINSTTPLWQSDPTSVSNGGDEVWNFTLSAPTKGTFFNLTAYALFLDNGAWTYFKNTVNGPGVSQLSVKVGKTANLDVNVGTSNIGVTVNGATERTSPSGDASFTVAVADASTVSVPSLFEFQNATRMIFAHWSDGLTQPERRVLIDGDTNLTAVYKIQYLLTVSAGSKFEEWYDKGANATLTVPNSPPVPWPLAIFGVTRTFHAWSGDVESSLPQVNVTMDSPKTVAAEFTTDYHPLAIPTILGLGMAATIISFVLIHDRSGYGEPSVLESAAGTAAPDMAPACQKCGKEIEPEWAHCIKCGTKLGNR